MYSDASCILAYINSILTIPYFRNFQFVRVNSLGGRYSYNMHIVIKIEIVFAFNVKDNNIFPCLHNIRLYYSI